MLGSKCLERAWGQVRRSPGLDLMQCNAMQGRWMDEGRIGGGDIGWLGRWVGLGEGRVLEEWR